MVKLKVEGMTCDHCVRAVTKALQGLAGASRVEVSLSAGEAVVEGNVDPSAAIAAVQREGYEARPLG